MRYAFPLIAAALLSACGEKTAENVTVTDNLAAENVEEVPANEEPVDANLIEADIAGDGGSAAATDAWVGRWTGPEGLALDIARAETPGSYNLKITLLDGTQSYVGTASGDTIRFTRNGAQAAIRKASGDETGLKYLAGKQNCLMIGQAEGFCRD